MKIDKNTIKEMAFWVRVRIPDDEAEVMAEEFTETLDWMGERLKNPEINSVPPMVTPFDEPIHMRQDVVTDGNKREQVLANAPAGATDEFFSVPKIIDNVQSKTANILNSVFRKTFFSAFHRRQMRM